MKLDPNNLDLDKHAKEMAELAYAEMMSAHSFAYQVIHGNKTEEREAEIEFLRGVVGPDHYEVREYLELAKVIGIDEAMEYARNVRYTAITEVEVLWQEKNGLDMCYECSEFFEKEELFDHPNVGLLCEDCALGYDDENEEDN